MLVHFFEICADGATQRLKNRQMEDRAHQKVIATDGLGLVTSAAKSSTFVSDVIGKRANAKGSSAKELDAYLTAQADE